MVVAFERIVRPFQTQDVSPPASGINPTSAEVPDLELSFGEDGTIKTLNGNASGEITAYTDDNHKELSRETHKKRVENPDDSTQYVDVEVIDTLITEKGKQENYKKSKYTLNNEDE